MPKPQAPNPVGPLMNYGCALVNSLLHARKVSGLEPDKQQALTFGVLQLLGKLLDYLIEDLIDKGYDPAQVVLALEAAIKRWSPPRK